MRHSPRARVRHLRTTREILRSHLPTLYNAIALACAAVLLFAGDSFHLSFLPLVVLNAALGIGAELAFRRNMDALNTPEMPAVVLHGEGHEERPAEALAVGDRLRLDAGSPVPADCTVTDGAVLADVSLLDGRSAHVSFAEGDALPAGATVVQGACEAVVAATGERTRLHQAESEARGHAEPRSEMARGITRLIRVLTVLALPLCLLKYLLYVRHGDAAAHAAASAAGSLMGMLPAAMLLLAAAAMLLSTVLLRRRQVLARDLYSVEMFGRIDTLCLDKTGTLTCGTAGDVLRGEAREAVAYFQSAGIDVRVLTGDTPQAAETIARALHLPGPIVDCALLPDDGALAAAAAFGGVFANATAGQNAQLIAALRADGRCVGMVGDGVNDIAAFRTADCSVALPHGCEAGRSAAQLVLLDEDLLALPDIVREAQHIIGSVTRTAELFVKKSLTSMIVLLIALITPLEYPFSPRQLSIVALFTIGLPALAFTFERESAPTHGHFVRSVFLEAVPGTLLSLLCVLAAMVSGGPLGLSGTEGVTLCVYAYAVSGMLVLLHICRPFDRNRAMLSITMGACLFAALALLRAPLGIALPTPQMLPVLLPLAALGYPLLFLLVRIMERLSRRRRQKAPHPDE